MKQFTENIKKFQFSIGLLLFIMIFGFLSGSFGCPNINRNQNEIGELPQSQEIPVFIEIGTSLGLNWTDYPSISGLGTIASPFIIENKTFDITENPFGIYINTSKCYAIIRNCSFFNSNSSHYPNAIVLNNSANVIIEDSSFQNGLNGVYLQTAVNITVNDNLFIAQSNAGVFVEYSQKNTVQRNIFTNQLFASIYSRRSSKNHFKDNIIENSNAYGILSKKSNFNSFTSNLINNSHGIGIHFQCSINNTFYSNQVDNTTLIGVNFEGSFNNSIQKNNITKSRQYGIYIDETSTGNQVFENFILESGVDPIFSMGDNNTVYNNYFEPFDDPSDDDNSDTSIPGYNSILLIIMGFGTVWMRKLKKEKDF